EDSKSKSAFQPDLRTERQIQRDVLHNLEWRAPAGTTWYHIPNGGYRRPVEAAILKSLGVVAGMPDLAVIQNGRSFFLELKSARGRLSENQKACHERLRDAGCVVGVAGSVDQALDLLQTWGVLS